MNRKIAEKLIGDLMRTAARILHDYDPSITKCLISIDQMYINDYECHAFVDDPAKKFGYLLNVTEELKTEEENDD